MKAYHRSQDITIIDVIDFGTPVVLSGSHARIRRFSKNTAAS
jgi:hypothetical protein